MTRDDLAALDDDALVGLANRGLVKRAKAELSRGEVPTLTLEDDGSLVAERGGVTTRLAPGVPLARTECSCDARGMCRHRVLAVLAYRAQADAPDARSAANVSDEELRAHLDKWVYRRAERRRDAGMSAEVITATRSVELPTCTVRFTRDAELTHARCDCREDRCAHLALAVWAFRDADPGAARSRVRLGASVELAREAIEPARALGRELVEEGALARGPGLALRFARARQPLEQADLRWPLEACEALERTLEAYTERGSTFEPGQVAALVTEIEARARAGGLALGAAQPEQTRLGETRLVSLGARVTARDDTHTQVHVYLADPIAEVVLVHALRFAHEAGAPELARRPAMRGVSLGALARGQLVTRAAKRLASRELVFAPSRRADTSVTPQRGAWHALGCRLCPDAASLSAELAARPPRLIEPRVLASTVRALRVHGVSDLGWRASEQTLTCTLHIDGGEVRLELEHSPLRGRALDAALDCLERGPRFVSGELSRDAGGLLIRPLAFVTDEVVVLDLADAAPSRLPPTNDPPPSDPLRAALREARDVIDEASHQGLRHVGASWHGRRESASRALADLGLATCAAQLGALSTPTLDAWLDASLRVRLALERLS